MAIGSKEGKKKVIKSEQTGANAGLKARPAHYHQLHSLSASAEAAIRGNDKSLANLVEQLCWHMATLPRTPPRNRDDHIFSLSLELAA